MHNLRDLIILFFQSMQAKLIEARGDLSDFDAFLNEAKKSLAKNSGVRH